MNHIKKYIYISVLILTSGIIASSLHAKSIDEMSVNEIYAILDQQLVEMKKPIPADNQLKTKQEPSFKERSPVLRSRMLATASRLLNDCYAGGLREQELKELPCTEK